MSGTESPSVRVLLVDDFPVVRRGVRNVLSAVDGVEVVGEAATSDDALAQVTSLRPDIVFMDISLPGIGGIKLTRQVCRTYPEVKIIILTFHEADEYLLQAMRAGASGYVVKGAFAEELVAAIEAVRGGGVYVDPVQIRRLVWWQPRSSVRPPSPIGCAGTRGRAAEMRLPRALSGRVFPTV